MDEDEVARGGTEADATVLAPGPHNVKLLKRAVYIMGVALVAGMIVVIGAIVWKASRLPASQVRDFGETAVAVPPGASVKHTAFSGDRLAVTVESQGKAEILIIDARRGTLLGRIRLTNEPAP